MFKIFALLFIITNCQADLTNINAIVRRKFDDKEYEVVHGKSLYELEKYGSILIMNTTIETLEKDDVKDLSDLQELSLSTVRLKELKPGCFHNVEKLKYLHFVENPLNKIPAGVFENLRVIILSLEDNRIGKIDDYSFKNLLHLRELHLSNNRLRNINPNWFVNCRRLRELHLSANKIDKIQPKAFEQFEDLKILTLAWNNLKTIVSNSFVGLKNLKVLTLSSNQIDIIEDGALAPIKGLRFLRLVNNNLQCLSEEVLNSLHHGCNIYMSLNHLGSECTTRLRQFKMNNPHIHILY